MEVKLINEVPQSPSISPTSLWLTAAGNGVVNASSNLGNYADRYELQQQIDGVWVTVAQGTAREDGVDYQMSFVASGSQSFRVVARWGFFAGFPAKSNTVEVS